MGKKRAEKEMSDSESEEETIERVKPKKEKKNKEKKEEESSEEESSEEESEPKKNKEEKKTDDVKKAEEAENEKNKEADSNLILTQYEKSSAMDAPFFNTKPMFEVMQGKDDKYSKFTENYEVWLMEYPKELTMFQSNPELKTALKNFTLEAEINPNSSKFSKKMFEIDNPKSSEQNGTYEIFDLSDSKVLEILKPLFPASTQPSKKSSSSSSSSETSFFQTIPFSRFLKIRKVPEKPQKIVLDSVPDYKSYQKVWFCFFFFMSQNFFFHFFFFNSKKGTKQSCISKKFGWRSKEWENCDNFG